MDSDEETNVPSWKGAAGTIILLNLYDPCNRNFASKAKSCVEKNIKLYLRSSSSQHVAVCFYGIEDENALLLDAKGIVEIFPLTQPTLQDYKKLCDTDIEKFKQSSHLKMSDALWHCNKMFANFKKQLSSRTLLILTRLDIPPVEADKEPSYIRVTELIDATVNIKFLNIAEDDYKMDEFYHNFLTEVHKGSDFIPPPPLWDNEAIQNILYQESHRHLAIAKLDFEIGENFTIGVGLYSFIKSAQSFHKKVNLDAETNTTLTSVTKRLKVTNNDDCSDVSAEDENMNEALPVLKSEILHYVFCGGEKICFTDSEMKKLKNPFGPPKLKLLGFKPSSTLCKEKWYLKPCYFLYPNEKLVEGSTVAFKAMFQACKEMSMVAICVLCSRINARPKIVALSPSKNPAGLNVEIGFDVIQIPFVENVREVPEVDDIEGNVSENQIKFMKNMLKGTEFEFKTTSFENPKLQAEYRAIEAIALEDDDVEPFHDTTVANDERFQIIDADLFNQLFGPLETVVPKRSNRANSDIPGGKKQKLDELLVDESELREKILNKGLNKYTVSQLKNILKSKSIPNLPALTGLKKNELMALVYEYFP